MTRRVSLTILTTFATLTLFSLQSFAQDPFTPNIKPRLEVKRVAGTIKIDADLSDPGWLGAATANNFSEHSPGEMILPPVSTQVKVAYDSENFYLAFICQDDPASVRATMCDRDNIFAGDYIGMILDTYGDAAWAYELFFNPLGLQGDLKMISGGDEDMSFDLVMHSRGRLTDTGWVVEVAVPFSSLRFPDRPVQEWRATFWRDRKRNARERSTWAAIDRDEPCFMCQFGYLVGMEGAVPGSRLEVLPYVVGSQASTIKNEDDLRSGLDAKNPDGDAGINLRYLLSSDLNADIAINPDFSQVESDAAQIDVNNNFAIFYPERRPFFQEGADQFGSYTNVIYTRSINDPLVAAKVTGRIGPRTSIGFAAARDENSPVIVPFDEFTRLAANGKSTSNLLRLRHSVGDDSYLGFTGTDRRLDSGGSGTVVGPDFSLRFLKKYRLQAQALFSHTREPEAPALFGEDDDLHFDKNRLTASFDGEKFWGHNFYGSLKRDARFWNFDLSVRSVNPRFRADNGFVFRNNLREGNIWNGFFLRPNRKVITEANFYLSTGRIWNYDGRRKDEWVSPEIYLLFPAQTSLEIGGLLSRETFRGVYFGGIRHINVEIESQFSELLHFAAGVNRHRYIARFVSPPVLGDGWEYGVEASIRAGNRLLVIPSWQYSELNYPDDGANIFAGYVLRTRFNYQFTREWFLRMIVQYDSFDNIFSFEPLLSYKFNPFTIFYLGSTHGYANLSNPDDLAPTGRQIFFKLQYLLRT